MEELQRVSSCQPPLWSCSPASTFLFPHWCSAAYLGQRDGVQYVWFGQNIGAFVVTQLCAVLDPPYSEGRVQRLWRRPRLIDTFSVVLMKLRNEIPFFPPSGHPSANYTFLQSMLPLLFHHKEKKKNTGSDVATGVCHMSSPRCLIPECCCCGVRQKHFEESSLKYLRLPGGRDKTACSLTPFTCRIRHWLAQTTFYRIKSFCRKSVKMDCESKTNIWDFTPTVIRSRIWHLSDYQNHRK